MAFWAAAVVGDQKNRRPRLAVSESTWLMPIRAPARTVVHSEARCKATQMATLVVEVEAGVVRAAKAAVRVAVVEAVGMGHQDLFHQE